VEDIHLIHFACCGDSIPMVVFNCLISFGVRYPCFADADVLSVVWNASTVNRFIYRLLLVYEAAYFCMFFHG